MIIGTANVINAEILYRLAVDDISQLYRHFKDRVDEDPVGRLLLKNIKSEYESSPDWRE